MLKEPLAADELKEIALNGNLTVKELLNPKSAGFKKLGLDFSAINEEQAACLINEHPRMMRRPLITDGKRLLFGFDAEKYAAFVAL